MTPLYINHTRVAFFSLLREGDGPKLVKRDAPLFPGDRLKGGQYISSCTSILATGCKPKYFEVRSLMLLFLCRPQAKRRGHGELVSCFLPLVSCFCVWVCLVRSWKELQCFASLRGMFLVGTRSFGQPQSQIHHLYPKAGFALANM